MNKFALVVKQDDHSHHIAAKIKTALCEGGWTFDLEKAELVIWISCKMFSFSVSIQEHLAF